MIDEQTLEWDQFLRAVTFHLSQGAGLIELHDLARSLRVDPAWLQDSIRFSDTSYARHLLYQNDLFDAWCLCWQGEQRSTIHNHGQSFGVAMVCEGLLREEVFRRMEGDRVECFHERILQPGDLTAAPRGMIHRLSNAGGPHSQLVTLHVYAGPLDTMEVFDPVAGRATPVPMRA